MAGGSIIFGDRFQEGQHQVLCSREGAQGLLGHQLQWHFRAHRRELRVGQRSHALCPSDCWKVKWQTIGERFHICGHTLRATPIHAWGFPSKTLSNSHNACPLLASGFWLQIPKVRDRAFFVTVFSAFCPEPADMWVSKDQNSEGVVPLSSTEQDHRVRSQWNRRPDVC